MLKSRDTDELDSLCGFSQCRRPTLYFWGCAPRGGLWRPNSNLAKIFVQCTYPQVPSICVYSFGSYRVDKQTDRQTDRRPWKHQTLFVMLRLWV